MTLVNKERLYKIIHAPRVTEKSSMVAETANQVVFEVAKDANKAEIKQAVEGLFKVEVKHVRIANVKGKKRLFKQTQGKRKDWKKAYVSLKEGYDINFAGKE